MLLNIKIDPLTLKKIRRFKLIKRGYYSFILLLLLILFSIFAEVFINSRAVVVRYEGHWYFPAYGKILPGTTFGLDYDYETNYRELKQKFADDKNGNFVIMPIVPYNEYENDLKEGIYPPSPPSWSDKHFLGTDSTGRDILARLCYGFRIAIFFSIILLICNYTVGVSIGCMMGYFGGKFDLFFQRLIEIWSNLPFIYLVIIMASIMTPNLPMLIFIMVFFGWMTMTWQMRTTTYREKEKEYTLAARSLGASHLRIIFKHILPNSISLIVTYVPFSIAGGMTSLTALDYLGYGLPAPTPSFGELLKQGTENLSASWIVTSVTVSMICILVMVTFIGESIREAFDPKQHSTYE